MDVEEEIKQHLLWRAMIESLFEEDSKGFALPAVISNDHHCQLGKWIYSHESDQYADNPVFKQLCESHKAFHVAAGVIITLFQQGDIEQARQHEKEFYRLSEDVIQNLKGL